MAMQVRVGSGAGMLPESQLEREFEELRQKRDQVKSLFRHRVMANVRRASGLIDDVRAAGVTDFCVCAGSRNSPLLAVLGVLTDVRLFSFVDERSAAFFALGRAKQHGVPVAIVTTSGTAVAELLPAAIEAFYSGIPLILISADRPARYRGTGAPQSIEQEAIFGVYAETSLESWSRTTPLHLNIEFDEPLIDETFGVRQPQLPLSYATEPRADIRTQTAAAVALQTVGHRRRSGERITAIAFAISSASSTRQPTPSRSPACAKNPIFR